MSLEAAFAPSAVRLAGFCCLHFGWSPDAFWVATPAEVGAVVVVLAPDGPAPVTTEELRRLEGGDG